MFSRFIEDEEGLRGTYVSACGCLQEQIKIKVYEGQMKQLQIKPTLHIEYLNSYEKQY